MSKPAHKIRNGVLQVTIWRNSGDKGNWYKRAIVQAAAHAQRAADFLHALQPAIPTPGGQP